MPLSDQQLCQLDRHLTWLGFRQLLPISLFVAAFGAAFGLAATQVGISNSNIMLMSALVFAGASQFAVLDLWGTQVPLLALIITVFAINARHLLMGATLYPWLKQLPPKKRYGTMFVVSDANWAMSLQAFNQGKPGFGLLLGGGIALWTFWVTGTWLGVYFGNVIQDPKMLGLDMVMGCFLLTMVIGGEKNLRALVIWGTAGLSSMLAFYYLPENSHVVVGAIAGGLAGVFYSGAKS